MLHLLLALMFQRFPIVTPAMQIEGGDAAARSQNHRIFSAGRDPYRPPGPTPLQRMATPTAPSGAQSPLQPDLGCLQGWGTHHLSGQPVSVPQLPLVYVAGDGISSPAWPAEPWPRG